MTKPKPFSYGFVCDIVSFFSPLLLYFFFSIPLCLCHSQNAILSNKQSRTNSQHLSMYCGVFPSSSHFLCAPRLVGSLSSCQRFIHLMCSSSFHCINPQMSWLHGIIIAWMKKMETAIQTIWNGSLAAPFLLTTIFFYSKITQNIKTDSSCSRRNSLLNFSRKIFQKSNRLHVAFKTYASQMSKRSNDLYFCLK